MARKARYEMLAEDRFWDLIERARREIEVADVQAIVFRLEALLSERLSPDEIRGFDDRLQEILSRGYTRAMSVAHVVITGYASDDAFFYFLQWLALQGRSAFEAAIADANAIADIPAKGAAQGCEALASVAAGAYKQTVKRQMPSSSFKADHALRGEKLTEHPETSLRRLWAKYRNPDGVPWSVVPYLEKDSR